MIRRYVLTALVLLALPVIFLIVEQSVARLLPDGLARAPDAAAVAATAECKAVFLENRPATPFDPTVAPCLCARAALDPSAAPPAGSATALACRLPALSTLAPATAWTAQESAMLTVVAKDVAARQLFAIPAALLVVLSLPVFAVAAIGLWQVGGGRWLGFGLALSAGAVVFGAMFSDDHPLRLFLVEFMLRRVAEDAAYPFFDIAGWTLLKAVVDGSTIIAMAATAMLFALAARLAVQSSDASTARLRERGRWLRLATAAGSALLALTVAAGYGLLHWSTALADPTAQKALAEIASSALTYWGVLWSLGIALMVIPPLISLRLDMERAAASSGEDAATLFAETGVGFDLKRAASFALAIAAPALTGPALDLLKQLGGV